MVCASPPAAFTCFARAHTDKARRQRGSGAACQVAQGAGGAGLLLLPAVRNRTGTSHRFIAAA